MQRVSIILFLFCLPILTLAQDHSFDTTFVCGSGIVYVSVKDIDHSSTLLTATYDARASLYDTIDTDGLADIQFPDFNKDGYSDILLSYFGNNPIYALYLFDSITKRFREIEDYGKYPDALQLKSNPKYYYSYHRSGCADMNWVSDLFKIENFNVIQLGHIYGQGCDFEVKQNLQVIEIYKIVGNNEDNRTLVAKLPYLKFISDFGDKWDFLEEYWNKNYRKFDPAAVPLNKKRK